MDEETGISSPITILVTLRCSFYSSGDICHFIYSKEFSVPLHIAITSKLIFLNIYYMYIFYTCVSALLF
jgi:hypothetical protein